MKKILSVILLLAVIAALCTTPASAVTDWEADFYYGAGAPYYLNYPTKAQILAKIRELDIDFSYEDQYAEDYSLDAPNYVPGSLMPETEERALSVLNLYRYVAGVPADVEVKNDYSQLAQAAMLVNAANGKLSHYPDKPQGMSDELYQFARQGAGQSNLGWNLGNLAYSFQNGWMDDSDANNIDTMGHRRWVLNPAMKYTGFGRVGAYTAMYSFDKSRSGQFAGDYVAWPAPNTPLEMFRGSAFSFTLGRDYDAPVAQKINITVTSETLGKTWTINSGNPEKGFYVETNGYGINKCVIFKATDFIADDTLTVHIDGLTKNGVAAPIDYTANLFSLSEIEPDSKTIMIRPRWGADFNVTASSMLTKSAPEIDWKTADGTVAGIYLYGEDNHRIYYGVGEGRTTITLSTPGASVDVDVIVKFSKFLLGDADGDEEITITDATSIQRHTAEMEQPTFCDYVSDVDSDDEIDISDATAIQRYMADMETPYPIGVSQLSTFTY